MPKPVPKTMWVDLIVVARAIAGFPHHHLSKCNKLFVNGIYEENGADDIGYILVDGSARRFVEYEEVLEEVYPRVKGREIPVSDVEQFHYTARVLATQIKGHPDYYITRCGCVCSTFYNKIKILQSVIRKDGYCYITLDEKTYGIHILVAKTYIPNDDPKKTHVDHKNDFKSDNRRENLQHLTHQENMIKSALAKHRKTQIDKVDVDGNLITHYDSIIDAAKEFVKDESIFSKDVLDGIKKIRKACRDVHKTFEQYWKYPETEWVKPRSNNKKVVKIDIKIGKIVHTYDSVGATGNENMGTYIKQSGGSYIKGEFRYEFETKHDIIELKDLKSDEWQPVPNFPDYLFSEKRRWIYCISYKRYLPKNKREIYTLRNKGHPRVSISFNSLIKHDLSFLKSDDWRQIPDFSSYYINKKAELYSTLTHTFFKGSLNPNGYATTALKADDGDTKKFQIHQLMGLVWLPNPEKKRTVNHKDKDGYNNNLENLEWATMREQHLHKEATRARGYVIIQFDEDGEVIAEFNNIKAASEATGLVHHKLKRAIVYNKRTDISATNNNQCYWRKVPT